MHQNIAVILWQLIYGKISFISLIPAVSISPFLPKTITASVYLSNCTINDVNLKSGLEQCAQIGRFWKFLATNSFSKVPQKDCWLLGFIENDQLM